MFKIEKYLKLDPELYLANPARVTNFLFNKFDKDIFKNDPTRVGRLDLAVIGLIGRTKQYATRE